jgi:hypothetical protein
MLSAAQSFMQIKSRQAAEFINEMVALELIESTMPFENKSAFQVATRGHAFANATAAKPIHRGTAERVLKEFMDRVNAVNASKEYAFKVKSAVLFGSLQSCVDRLLAQALTNTMASDIPFPPFAVVPEKKYGPRGSLRSSPTPPCR